MSEFVPFTKLEVWKRSIDYAHMVYGETKGFPKGHYGLSDQLNRSSISISSNIAEGKGRGSGKDFLKFLIIARGSLYESQSQLLLCKRFELLAEKKYIEIYTLSIEVSKALNVLISKLKKAL